jgi:type IV secretion system protein VirD4
LGTERLVVILENCKPILASKIRYHRDKVFMSRLCSPPGVPAMDMDIHWARVQQRTRELDDSDVVEGKTVDLASLAHDFNDLAELTGDSPPEDVAAFVDDFFSRLVVEPGPAAADQEDSRQPSEVQGGSIEELTHDADETIDFPPPNTRLDLSVLDK